MDRLVDALGGTRSDVGAVYVGSPADLPEDVFADQDLAGLRHAPHARRTVHAVPINVPVGRDGDVTEVHTDA
jgi:hypothetical protein